MVNNCCVVGRNSNNYRAESVPIFKYPKKDNIKDRWIRLANRKKWQPSI